MQYKVFYHAEREQLPTDYILSNQGTLEEVQEECLFWGIGATLVNERGMTEGYVGHGGTFHLNLDPTR